MPDIQEVIALGIVAVVAGRLLWKRWARRHGAKPAAKSATGRAPKEATVRFYRRRNAEDRASETPDDEL